MDERVRNLIVSAVLAFIVFSLGVYVGSSMNRAEDREPGEEICSVAKTWYNGYESSLQPFWNTLPPRLEEGNYDVGQIREYMSVMYQYYMLYNQHWRTCGLLPPVVYFAGRGENSLRCGELLDRFRGKIKLFVFLYDENIPVVTALAKYFGVDSTPTVFICGRRVACDEGDISAALRRC